MLVIKLDFAYYCLNLLEAEGGQLSSFTGKEEHVMVLQCFFCFPGSKVSTEVINKVFEHNLVCSV